MLGSHLQALLKKNLLIAKSTFVLTAIEVLAPILIMLALLGLKSLFKKEIIPFEGDEKYIRTNTSFAFTNLAQSLGGLVQNVQYFDSFYMCDERNVIAFIGKNFPSNLANKFINKVPEGMDVNFRYYDNYETLSDYVESSDYGEIEGEICFAISFKKEGNKYTYKLHYFASPYNGNEPPQIPTTYMGIGNVLRTQPDFPSYLKYASSGFFLAQKLFYDYVLQEETGISDAEINLMILPKKFEKYIEDPFAENSQMLIGMFSIIAYAGPLIINIYRIVKEKETKAKEGMKIMGLSEVTYFLSNLIIYFVKNLLYSGFITLILKYALKRIESGYIFLMYFLYGLVIFALTFFFQSFLERTIIAILVSLLIYVLMYFFFIVVFQYSVNYAVKFIFCLLFPPTNLQLGINSILDFETNFQDFNGRIEYEYNNFCVRDMYILFSLNFILYMFIGFFLQNALPHEYGIKQHVYFLCTKNFWGIEDNNKEDINIILQENNINNNNDTEKIPKINKDNNSEVVLSVRNNKNDKNDITENNKKEINLEEIKNDDGYQHPSSKELINQKDIISIKDNISDKNKKIEEENNNPNFESEEFYKMNYTKPRDSFKIRNICKVFEDGKKALNGVSFNLYKNEIFALLGHNGAGKSTLISILSGLYSATSGYAIYDNQNILSTEGHSKFRKYLGICPQHDVLLDDLTVKEHLEMF